MGIWCFEVDIVLGHLLCAILLSEQFLTSLPCAVISYLLSRLLTSDHDLVILVTDISIGSLGYQIKAHASGIQAAQLMEMGSFLDSNFLQKIIHNNR
jgi:hypothetical protein